ncbi:MAG: AMIN domain-containing protein [Chromatiales bacterium]|nr:AMIN domain-containing protein [Chromatiales bacterium]
MDPKQKHIGWCGRAKPSSCRASKACQFAALIFLLLLGPLNVWAADNVLKNVTFNAMPGNRVQVIMEMANPVVEPRHFATDNPARIALDFFNTSNNFGQKNQTVNVGKVRSVTAIEASGRTRVVSILSVRLSTKFTLKEIRLF